MSGRVLAAIRSLCLCALIGGLGEQLTQSSPPSTGSPRADDTHVLHSANHRALRFGSLGKTGSKLFIENVVVLGGKTSHLSALVVAIQEQEPDEWSALGA